MLPRRVVPGQVWFVTRRCLEGRFLLRPDPEVSQIVLYCLAWAAERTGVRVCAVIQMSNHWHLVIEDVEARLGEFLQIAHYFITRAVNSARGRRDSVFEAGETTCIPVETMEDAVRIMAYIEANPVKDGLVRRAKDWPGVSSVELEFGESVSVPRPEAYFAKFGSSAPDGVKLTLEAPPDLGSGLGPKQIRQRVRLRLRDLERQAKKDHPNALGVKKVLAQDPNGSPEEPPERKPPMASCIPEVAKRIRQREAEFQNAYSAARARWVEDKDTVMPYGTYWLRVFAGAQCEEAPPDHWAA